MLSRSVVSFTFYLVSTLPYAVHKVVVLTRPVYLQNALCTQSLSHVRLFATLWDCSPPGSFVHGDSRGKNSGVGYHALL